MSTQSAPIHVSLLAIPESLAFPITSIFETLQLIGRLDGTGIQGSTPFQVEIVGREPGMLQTASGLPITVQRGFDEVEHTDVVIATSMSADENNEWSTGRHPKAVDWLQEMYSQDAVMCSSCTGVLLLAETGLLAGHDATIHWAYAPTFQRNFPDVRLQLKEVLVIEGQRREFIMAGATSSWQDLALYLVSRYIDPGVARAMGKFMLFQWHAETMAPYVTFVPPLDHGDAVIRDLQEWVAENVCSGSPLDEMTRRSGLSEATFKRRFKQATGYSPLRYVQEMRVEAAKRHLEETDSPIEEVGWQIGYENTAFFRRLFKRTTRMTPAEYRKKFQIPDFARV